MKRYFFSFAALLAVFTLVGNAHALDKNDKQKQAEPAETVEFFKAIEDGVIEVKFIPKDASQATLIVKNKGNQPLIVNPPAAFGAVHVLGQFGGGMGGMGGGGMGGMGGGGMGGGGMGGMGGGMGGMGGGMFRVAPDKATKLTVPCVCLEHGKKDPNPQMQYKIVPIEQVNADPKVAELCSLLGRGKVAQNTAQAAAWHMANGLSWDQLAHKNRVESKYTGNIRFFNSAELQNAFQVSQTITRFYKENDAAAPSLSSSKNAAGE